MSNSIDDLLNALPRPVLDHPLDQLEPQVWRRIDLRRRAAAASLPGLRFQLAAAGLAMVIGIALGWATHASRGGDSSPSPLYASYVASGPMGQLEAGL